jgi:hypothetical protein
MNNTNNMNMENSTSYQVRKNEGSKFSGFHGGDVSRRGLLGCDAV